MSDFIRNHKAHLARLKETRSPEALTVNGRAEVVVIDAETYQNLMDEMRDLQAISRTRAKFHRVASNYTDETAVTDEEIERAHQIVDELVAETERLGLYK